jgi:putative tryptophan/tyrosine transport system substrate-binding protein
VRRREFIGLLGGMAVWPLAVRARQTPSLPVVAYMHGGFPKPYEFLATALREGLRDLGYIDGKNVAIEFHWGEGNDDRLSAIASELVHRRVAVIVAGGLPAAPIAKAATPSIPIVFTSAIDPVELRLVASLNRPGGNLTGVSMFNVSLDAKRTELLLELVPTATTIAVLVNPNALRSELDIAQVSAAARGRRVTVLKAADESELGAAFAALPAARADALFVAAEPLFLSLRQQVVELAARHSIPAIYDFREFVDDGGLISYGMNLTGAYRKIVAIYISRILKGVHPADLPVVQPDTFELVINLRAAKSLSFGIPPTLLARADEVIE